MIEEPATADSLCFRSPAGQISPGRFQMLMDLVENVPDRVVMISRRQSLTLRGSLTDVPTYRLRELRSGEITRANVKSHPWFPADPLQQWVINQLDTLSRQFPRITLSYSHVPRERAVLLQDDLTISRTRPDEFRVTTGRGTNCPARLVDDLSRNQLATLFPALRELLDRQNSFFTGPPGNLPELRKNLFHELNEVEEPSSDRPPDPKEDPGDPLSESTFLSRSSAVSALEQPPGTYWLLVPVIGGVLEDSLQDRLLGALDQHPVQSMHLTPEQNLLLGLSDRNSAGTLADVMKSHWPGDDSLPFLPRITTCPGSTFCSTVATQPVDLARKLVERFENTPPYIRFNHQHPIGISGCGETRERERLQSLGLVPDDRERYRLSMGGRTHGKGHFGWLKPDSIPEAQVVERITRIIDQYQASSAVSFKQWARNRWGKEEG